MSSLPVEKKRRYNNNNPVDPRRNHQSMVRQGYSQQQPSYDYRGNYPEGARNRLPKEDRDESSSEWSNSSSTLKGRRGEKSRESTSSEDSSESEEEKHDSFRGWPKFKFREPEGRNYEFLRPSPSPKRKEVQQSEPMVIDSSSSDDDDHVPTETDMLNRTIIKLGRKIAGLTKENKSVEKRIKVLVDALEDKKEKIREMKEYIRKSKYKQKWQETVKELKSTKSIFRLAYDYMDPTSQVFAAARIGKEEFGKVQWLGQGQDWRPDQVERIHDDQLHVQGKSHNDHMNGIYKIVVRTTFEDKKDNFRVTLQNYQTGLVTLLRDPYARNLQNMDGEVFTAYLAGIKIKAVRTIWLPNHAKLATRPGVELFTHISYLDNTPDPRRRPAPPRREPMQEVVIKEEPKH